MVTVLVTAPKGTESAGSRQGHMKPATLMPDSIATMLTSDAQEGA
jgi:hypothetical protein